MNKCFFFIEAHLIIDMAYCEFCHIYGKCMENWFVVYYHFFAFFVSLPWIPNCRTPNPSMLSDVSLETEAASAGITSWLLDSPLPVARVSCLLESFFPRLPTSLYHLHHCTGVLVMPEDEVTTAAILDRLFFPTSACFGAIPPPV